VTNSICHNTQNSAMIESPGWSLVHDYNCAWQVLYSPVKDDDIGPNSMEADPLFADARNGDFRLQDSSPCIGAASDGKNIGSSQETVPTGIGPGPHLKTDVTAREIRIEPNPFTTSVAISISFHSNRIEVYDRRGKLVKSLVPRQSPGTSSMRGNLVKEGVPRQSPSTSLRLRSGQALRTGPGASRFVWEGTDQAGKQVPGGVYFVRWDTEQGTFAQRVVYTP